MNQNKRNIDGIVEKGPGMIIVIEDNYETERVMKIRTGKYQEMMVRQST